MAVLNSATASHRALYAGVPTTTSAILYTAPALTSNVTSPSATAYIKEIILANTTATAATVTIVANGVTIIGALSVSANDTKVIPLNTAIPASTTITALQGTSSAISVYISGVEVQ